MTASPATAGPPSASRAPSDSAGARLSVSIHFVRAVLRHCLEAGVDPQALLREQRIPPRLLREPNARISIQQYADLQTSTMQALRDESLGYARKPIPLGTWDMMCHAVINSGTLGKALHRYTRFFQLMERGLPISMERGEDAVELVLEAERSERGAYLAELSLVKTHRFACWLVEEELPLRAVNFAHAQSTRALDYQLMFYGNPVNFEQRRNSLDLASSLLDKPVSQTPDTLRSYLRHPTLIMFTTSYAFSWTARVRELLRGDLMHMPELTDVATLLELHPQTLRRRLAKEGITFKQIKSDVRRDTALHYLGKKNLNVEEVAHRAGFSEASAFIRAFKSWTGLTPYAYRKGL